jgi:hypothetical protein
MYFISGARFNFPIGRALLSAGRSARSILANDEIRRKIRGARRTDFAAVSDRALAAALHRAPSRRSSPAAVARPAFGFFKDHRGGRTNVALRLQSSMVGAAGRVREAAGVALTQLIKAEVAEKLSALRSPTFAGAETVRTS